ncbi:MAG: hypothetical protein ACOYLF_15280 [Blastocatellia bacterium]
MKDQREWLPDLCVVDTNVPITANLALRSGSGTVVPDECILACIEAIDHVIRHRGLILDAADEIFDEYRHHLSLRGQPGVGDKFLKWVHDHRWTLPAAQRVAITRSGESYLEFPAGDELKNFDRSDRKFIAVANASKTRWPILQATDSKWWGWSSALADLGIIVYFLCPDYISAKYTEKIAE